MATTSSIEQRSIDHIPLDERHGARITAVVDQPEYYFGTSQQHERQRESNAIQEYALHVYVKGASVHLPIRET